MSRRGFLDGRGLRLPTVSIRPGKANAAASSFMSSIFRDTMQGGTANCPVGPEFEVWHTAPRTVVANLIHAAELDAAAFGPNRCFDLSGPNRHHRHHDRRHDPRGGPRRLRPASAGTQTR